MAIGRAQMAKMIELGGAVSSKANKKKKYDPFGLISALQRGGQSSYVQGGNKAKAGVNYGKKMFAQENRNGKRDV